MMKQTTLALLTIAALGLAATVHADILWNWSFTTTVPATGAPANGSGTLTTGPLVDGSYDITGIGGTYDGFDISGLNTTYLAPDNKLYTPGFNGSGDDYLLSVHGLAFDFGFTPTQYEASFIDPNTIYYFGAYIGTDSAGNQNLGDFIATQAAPEPSQVISMLSLAGMDAAGLLLKLRRRK